MSGLTWRIRNYGGFVYDVGKIVGFSVCVKIKNKGFVVFTRAEEAVRELADTLRFFFFSSSGKEGWWNQRPLLQTCVNILFGGVSPPHLGNWKRERLALRRGINDDDVRFFLPSSLSHSKKKKKNAFQQKEDLRKLLFLEGFCPLLFFRERH
jgi:hypothetical protein